MQYRRTRHSDRQLLVKAMEAVVQTDRDYEVVSRYKEKLENYRTMQDKVNELTDRINVLMDKAEKTSKEKKALSHMITERDSLRKKLAHADETLLSMEAMTPLQKLIARERRRATAAGVYGQMLKASIHIETKIKRAVKNRCFLQPIKKSGQVPLFLSNIRCFLPKKA